MKKRGGGKAEQKIVREESATLSSCASQVRCLVTRKRTRVEPDHRACTGSLTVLLAEGLVRFVCECECHRKRRRA